MLCLFTGMHLRHLSRWRSGKKKLILSTFDNREGTWLLEEGMCSVTSNLNTSSPGLAESSRRPRREAPKTPCGARGPCEIPDELKTGNWLVVEWIVLSICWKSFCPAGRWFYSCIRLPNTSPCRQNGANPSRHK